MTNERKEGKSWSHEVGVSRGVQRHQSCIMERSSKESVVQGDVGKSIEGSVRAEVRGSRMWGGIGYFLTLPELHIKIGCPLILLWNLDPSQGLCNGTQMILWHAYCHLLEVEIIGSVTRKEHLSLASLLNQPTNIHFFFDAINSLSICYLPWLSIKLKANHSNLSAFTCCHLYFHMANYL